VNWRRWGDAIGGPNAISIWSWLITAPISLAATATRPDGSLAQAGPTWWLLVAGINVVLALLMLVAHLTVLSARTRKPRPVAALLVFAGLGAMRAVLHTAADAATGTHNISLVSRLTIGVPSAVILLAIIAIAVDRYRAHHRALQRLSAAETSLIAVRKQSLDLQEGLEEELLNSVRDEISFALQQSSASPATVKQAAELARTRSHDLAEDEPLPPAAASDPRRNWVDSLTATWRGMRMPNPWVAALLLEVLATVHLTWLYGITAGMVNLVVGFVAVFAVLTLTRRYWSGVPGVMRNGAAVFLASILAALTAAVAVSLTVPMFNTTLPFLGWQASVLLMMIVGGLSVAESVTSNMDRTEQRLQHAVRQAAEQAEIAQRHFTASRTKVANFLHGPIQAELLAGSVSGESPDELAARVYERFKNYEKDTGAEFSWATIENILQTWSTVMDIESSVSYLAREVLDADVTVAETTSHALSEAFANVLRHANSTKVEVLMEVQDDHLDLTVTSEGAASAMSRDGIGLQSLRQGTSVVELTSDEARTRLFVRV